MLWLINKNDSNILMFECGTFQDQEDQPLALSVNFYYFRASVKYLLVGIRKTTLIFVQKDGRGEGDEKRRRYEESWTKVEEERSRGGGERKKKRR